MTTANFSLSFALETDETTWPQVRERLTVQLAGRVKDLLAQALTGLEFDLQQRYWLLTEEEPASAPPRPPSPAAIPVWSPNEAQFIRVAVGSPEWFTIMSAARKFTYRYDQLDFTVRFETRKSKGREYTYWRAYATVGGQLLTKQLGPTKALTKEALDAVGAYFVRAR
jgi:hypothetical protein